MTDPSHGVTDPSDGVTDPSDGVTDPSDGVTDPSHGLTDPSDGLTDPSHGAMPPSGAVILAIIQSRQSPRTVSAFAIGVFTAPGAPAARSRRPELAPRAFSDAQNLTRGSGVDQGTSC